MLTKIIFLCSLLCWSIVVSAQPLTLLKKIGQVTPNTQSGLGQIFVGSKLNDGLLYFRASHDGFIDDMWKTDGTPSGTEKILSESNTGGWSLLDFVPEGIFLQNTTDHLLFYDIASEGTVDLGIFNGETFLIPAKFDVEHYIYLTHTDQDTAHLYITDMTASGTLFLGSLGAYNSFHTLSASPYGAVVYSTNSFSSFVPKIYVSATNQIMTVKDFLSPFKAVESVKTVTMYDHYMVLSVIEGGFTKNYIFDLRTHTFYTGNSFFGIVEDFYHHGGELIILSEREIVTLDTATFQIKEWTEKVFGLGTHIVHGDSLYYHGYTTGDTIKLHIFDLNTHSITVLNNSNIGFSNYDAPIEIHKNAIYYTHDTGPTIFLRKYNYGNQNYTDIDSITVRNGSLTIHNAVVEVNGILLVSKFNPEMGHELYYFNGTTGTKEMNIPQLSVFPNPCSDMLFLDMPQFSTGKVIILNSLGQVVLETQIYNQSIPISGLSGGLYSGLIVSGDLQYGFRFVKKE